MYEMFDEALTAVNLENPFWKEWMHGVRWLESASQFLKEGQHSIAVQLLNETGLDGGFIVAQAEERGCYDAQTLKDCMEDAKGHWTHTKK